MITNFGCSTNELKEINLDSNLYLTSLWVRWNKIEHLEINHLKGLNTLHATGNLLNSIRIDSLTELKELEISDNRITNINLNNSKNLSKLSCSKNLLETLDLAKNIELNFLECSDNQLENLNLENNIKLEVVFCEYNNIETLKIDNLNKLETLSCSKNRINILNVKSLKNLRIIDCSNNEISLLEVDSLLKLEYLSCDSNNIQELRVDNIISLNRIICYNNPINYLNVNRLINLDLLYIGNHSFLDIRIDSLPHLTYLYTSNLNLNDVNFAKLPNLEILEFDNSDFDSLHFPRLHFLRSLILNNNKHLKSIDCSKLNSLLGFSCIGNDSLTYVNLKNGVLGLDSLNLSNNPLLNHICCDANEIDYIKEHTQKIGRSDILVDSNCSIDKENKVKVIVYYDKNEDGSYNENDDELLPDCEIFVPNLSINFYTSISGDITYFTTNDSTSFTVTEPYSSSSWNENPRNIAIRLIDSLTTIYVPFIKYKVDKFVQPIINTGIIRCNALTSINLKLINSTENNINGKAILQYDERIKLRSDNPKFTRLNDSTVSWNVNNLSISNPFMSFAEGEIPAATSNNDSIYLMLSLVDDKGDTISIFRYSEVIRCSYDPNDKRSWPDRIGDDNLTLRSERFIYQIRFQNTGNDTAFVVRIADGLSKFLDPRSLQLLNSSHDVTMELVNDSLYFIFDNILLVDSTTNPLLSQGFVSFTIDEYANIPNYSEIFNKVLIYFDKNSPIVTNTIKNTIVNVLPCPISGIWSENNMIFVNKDINSYHWYECGTDSLLQITENPVFSPVKNGEYYAIINGHYCKTRTECITFISTNSDDPNNSTIKLYPNPVKDILYLEIQDDLISKVEVFDLQGRIVRSVSIINNQLNVSDLEQGSYVSKVYGHKGIGWVRFVKI